MPIAGRWLDPTGGVSASFASFGLAGPPSSVGPKWAEATNEAGMAIPIDSGRWLGCTTKY